MARGTYHVAQRPSVLGRQSFVGGRRSSVTGLRSSVLGRRSLLVPRNATHFLDASETLGALRFVHCVFKTRTANFEHCFYSRARTSNLEHRTLVLSLVLGHPSSVLRRRSFIILDHFVESLDHFGERTICRRRVGYLKSLKLSRFFLAASWHRACARIRSNRIVKRRKRQ